MILSRGERGFISFKVMFWVVVLFAVVHVLIKLVPMYIASEQMKDEMTTKARVAQVLKDEEILAGLVKKAKDLELPLADEDFVLIRDEQTTRMKISTQWDEEIIFFWGAYIRNFHFEPAIDESYSVKL